MIARGISRRLPVCILDVSHVGLRLFVPLQLIKLSIHVLCFTVERSQAQMISDLWSLRTGLSISRSFAMEAISLLPSCRGMVPFITVFPTHRQGILPSDAGFDPKFHSGMDELIRAVLTELAKGSDKDVVKDIPIVSNGVGRDATGKWFITWRHPERYPSPFFLPLPSLFSFLDKRGLVLIQRYEGTGSNPETNSLVVHTATTNRARSCPIRSTGKHTTVEARPYSSSVTVSRVRASSPFSPQLPFPHSPISLCLFFSSDLSAAKHADVLFVKVTGIDEKDNLKKHCDKAGIPYIPFFNFDVAKAIVGQIVRGEKTKDDFLVEPVATAN